MMMKWKLEQTNAYIYWVRVGLLGQLFTSENSMWFETVPVYPFTCISVGSCYSFSLYAVCTHCQSNNFHVVNFRLPFVVDLRHNACRSNLTLQMANSLRTEPLAAEIMTNWLAIRASSTFECTVWRQTTHTYSGTKCKMPNSTSSSLYYQTMLHSTDETWRSSLRSP